MLPWQGGGGGAAQSFLREKKERLPKQAQPGHKVQFLCTDNHSCVKPMPAIVHGLFAIQEEY